MPPGGNFVSGNIEFPRNPDAMTLMNFQDRQSLLITELSSVRTRGAFIAALKRVAAAFSLHHVTLLRMPGPDDRDLAPLVLETTYAPQFFRDFDRHGLLSICPTSHRLQASLLPQTWALKAVTEDEKTPEWQTLAGFMIGYGITMGIVIAMTGLDGERLVLRYAGERDCLQMDELNALNMVSTHVFEAYAAIRPREPALPHALSARELEVVRWTAQGKTSAEIGQILSLSDHTVNAYLNNAIKKLDCVNRTQLVAKAIRLKLIA